MAKWQDRFYEFLTNDDEPRACESIPDSDCTHVPGNFSKLVVNGTLSKLAEKLVSPSLTLPWLFSLLQAPQVLIGALVPIKDAGSLLPQLFVSGTVRGKAIRKHYWAGAAAFQGLMLLLSAFLLWQLPTQDTTWLLALLLLLFSIASGVASVAFKDVSAKTVPKGQRGQMLSFRSTFGGIVATVAAIVLVLWLRNENAASAFVWVYAIAGVLWLGAASVFASIAEKPGATKGGRNPAQEVRTGWHLLRDDIGYRRFIITRALLMAVPLLQPYFVMLTPQNDQNSVLFLGALILVGGLSQVLSSPFWGKLADVSTTKLMRISALLSLSSIALAVMLMQFSFASFYGLLPVFFINGMAYAGARLSRKTYLVDYAPSDERPTYVSVANTLIGLYTLVAATFGFVAQHLGLYWQFAFFGSMLIVVVLMSYRLVER